MATVVPSDGLNLRAGPAITFALLDLLPGGTRVALTGPLNPDGWYPAIYRMKRGWLRADFLDLGDEQATLTRRATVRTSDALALRREPHPESEVVRPLPSGAAITVSARASSDGWLLAAFGGSSGWLLAEGVQVEGAPSALPASTAPPRPSPAPAALPAPATTPAVTPGPAARRGTITYYAPSLEGGGMACGGRYHAEDASIAAATSWPCGTRLRVCYGAGCVSVTVQDTGHMGPNWVDLSSAAFRKLAPLPEGMITGTIEVMGGP